MADPREPSNNPAPATDCRCGRATASSHPCHHGFYTCSNEGAQRVIAKPLGTWSLAGAQMKSVVYVTNACEKHWDEYLASGACTDRTEEDS